MGRGRPAHVFSPEEIRRIAEALLDNNMSQKLAAAVMGISVSSFGNWLKSAKGCTGKYSRSNVSCGRPERKSGKSGDERERRRIRRARYIRSANRQNPGDENDDCES